MLPKKRRLKRKAFSETFSEGLFLSTNLFSLRIKKLSRLKNSNFAIVVPVGVTKSKPVRNRLKRQIYSIVQKLQKDGHKLAGASSVIVFLKKDAKNLGFSDLEVGICQIFKKGGLLK